MSFESLEEIKSEGAPLAELLRDVAGVAIRSADGMRAIGDQLDRIADEARALATAYQRAAQDMGVT